MKVSEKKLSDGRIHLSCVASVSEVDYAFYLAHGLFLRNMGLAFEEGKSAAQIAKEKMGVADLDSLCRRQAAEYLVPFAIDARNLDPAFPPSPESATFPERGKTFAFTLILTPKPHFVLDDYSLPTITLPRIEVSEQEIEDQINAMLESQTYFVKRENPLPVTEKDNLLLALEAFRAGERLDALSTEGRTYLMGMNLMPAAFEEQLLGMEVGQTKSFSFAAQGALPDAPLIDCTVSLLELQDKVVPELSDAWVQQNLPAYGSVEVLRERVKASLVAQKSRERDEKKVQKALMQLVGRFKGELSQEALEATRDSILSNFTADLNARGISLEQYIQSQGGQQQFAMMLAVQARQTLTESYILDSYFAHEKLKLEDADYAGVCRMINPQNPASARNNMEKSGRRYVLRELAVRSKARQWIAAHTPLQEEE